MRSSREIRGDIDYENTATGNSAAKCLVYVIHQASRSDSISDTSSDSPSSYDAHKVGYERRV